MACVWKCWQQIWIARKNSQKVLLRVAPPCNFHKQLFSSHKMLWQNAPDDQWSQLGTEANTFVREVFGQQNFFASKAPFLLLHIWVFCVGKPLWRRLKKSAAQILSKIVKFNQTMTIDYSCLGKFFNVFFFLSGRDASWPNIFFKVDVSLSLVVRE